VKNEYPFFSFLAGKVTIKEKYGVALKAAPSYHPFQTSQTVA
jgi:hypothetical protein